MKKLQEFFSFYPFLYSGILSILKKEIVIYLKQQSYHFTQAYSFYLFILWLTHKIFLQNDDFLLYVDNRFYYIM